MAGTTDKVTAAIERLESHAKWCDDQAMGDSQLLIEQWKGMAALLRAMVDILKELQGAFEQAGTQSSCYFAKDLLDLLPDEQVGEQFFAPTLDELIKADINPSDIDVRYQPGDPRRYGAKESP